MNFPIKKKNKNRIVKHDNDKIIFIIYLLYNTNLFIYYLFIKTDCNVKFIQNYIYFF